MRFGEHLKLVQQYIDREDMRARTYTQYEGLQLVLRTLHVNYRVALTKRVADEFGVAHDRVYTIPFTVHMSQLGTSLSAWADELGLHSRSASRVSFVGETLHSEIHALPNGQKCRLCGQDGHLDQTCHRFANHVIGDKLMRDNTALAKQVVSTNSSFITNSTRNKVQCTTSTIRQLSAPSLGIDDTVGPISMMEHP
jgi:hypothetical protein